MKADEIINILLSEFKTDKAGLATILDVHKSTISNISKGYTKRISPKLAQRIIGLKPELNYSFLVGASNQLRLTDDEDIAPASVFLTTKGRSRITVEEIATFVLNHIEEFEKNDIFSVYKSSVINQAKVELLQEQLLLKNTLKNDNEEEEDKED